MATFCDFSEEIVIQILSWLPVLYLLRCKSVCKQWVSIISDPIFTQTHLTNSQKRPSVLIGTAVRKSNYGFSRILKSFRSSVNLYVPSCLAENIKSYKSTSCNGLVCLTDIRCADIRLWNPATRQCCKILPSPKIQESEMFGDGPSIVFYYDSICNDYKILRIVDELPVQVELYSTNSETWREIKVDKEDTSFVRRGHASKITCGPVIKEVLYINKRRETISFHLRNEMFKLVPLPSIKLGRSRKPKSKIFEYEGCVGLIVHCLGDGALSLWTLDEDNGSGFVSWTKNFKLDTCFSIRSTTIYLGDGKLATKELSDIIILYDHKTKEIKKFHHPTWWYVKQPHKYTESLVSVKGFNK